MQQEQLFWSRLNGAVSSFCLERSLRRDSSHHTVCSFVGDELEWCGSHAFLFLAAHHVQQKRKLNDLECRSKQCEALLSSETQNLTTTRKQLKAAQLAAEDNEWHLQEQLAHANNTLQQEREVSNELRNKLAVAQGKLVEVESFLGSDRGAMALQLEEELAASKLRIADLEAEKDELEFMKRRVGASSSNGFDKENLSVIGNGGHRSNSGVFGGGVA